MVIEHRLQTEDFLATWKTTREKHIYFLKYQRLCIASTFLFYFTTKDFIKAPDYLITSVLAAGKGLNL